MNTELILRVPKAMELVFVLERTIKIASIPQLHYPFRHFCFFQSSLFLAVLINMFPASFLVSSVHLVAGLPGLLDLLRESDIVTA